MQASISCFLQLLIDPLQLTLSSGFGRVSFAFPLSPSTILPFFSPAGGLGAPKGLVLLSVLFDPFGSTGNVPLSLA